MKKTGIMLSLLMFFSACFGGNKNTDKQQISSTHKMIHEEDFEEEDFELNEEDNYDEDDIDEEEDEDWGEINIDDYEETDEEDEETDEEDEEYDEEEEEDEEYDEEDDWGDIDMDDLDEEELYYLKKYVLNTPKQQRKYKRFKTNDYEDSEII